MEGDHLNHAISSAKCHWWGYLWSFWSIIGGKLWVGMNIPKRKCNVLGMFASLLKGYALQDVWRLKSCKWFYFMCTIVVFCGDICCITRWHFAFLMRAVTSIHSVLPVAYSIVTSMYLSHYFFISLCDIFTILMISSDGFGIYWSVMSLDSEYFSGTFPFCYPTEFCYLNTL